jgi:thioredoxin 1
MSCSARWTQKPSSSSLPRQGISSIPTLMAFREKVLVFSQPGALNAQQLEQVVDAVKALDMDEVHAHVARQREEAAAAAPGRQDGTQIPEA